MSDPAILKEMVDYVCRAQFPIHPRVLSFKFGFLETNRGYTTFPKTRAAMDEAMDTVCVEHGIVIAAEANGYYQITDKDELKIYFHSLNKKIRNLINTKIRSMRAMRNMCKNGN